MEINFKEIYLRDLYEKGKADKKHLSTSDNKKIYKGY